MTESGENPGSPLIVAHRGAQDEAPENTERAFRLALEHGVDGIEFDVQMTRDGIPVLHHDRTLMRIAASRRRISDLSYYELQALARRGLYSTRLKGETVLTLERALRMLAGKTRLFIEIKSREHDRRSGHSLPLALRTADLIDRCVPPAFHGEVHILCFDTAVLRELSGRPRWKRIRNHRRPPLLRPDDPAGLWGHGVRIGRLREEDAAALRRRGLVLASWACNGPRQLSKALRLGVNLILTDRPGWLCGLRRAGRL